MASIRRKYAGRLYTCLAVFVLVLSSVIPHAGGAAAVDVRATVDRMAIDMTESVTLTITISGADDGTVDVSPIEDFSVDYQGASTSVQVINGSISRQVRRSYELTPEKEGVLEIPPLTVTVRGDTYRTAPVSVRVTKTAPHQGIRPDAFVEASVSDASPYAGQSIVYTFRFARAVQVANASLQEPEFLGFTVEHLDDERTYTKVLNGRRYTVTEMVWVLTPVKSGVHSLSPAILKAGLVRERRRHGGSHFGFLFDDPFFSGSTVVTRTLRTEPIRVDVRPLPPYTGREAFSGLVGDFRISSAVEKDRVRVGDSVTVAVTVEGRGNIKDADAPSMDVSDAFKVYRDTPEEDISVDHDGYSGKKIFRFALVPTRQGEYHLGPFSLAYFDPERKEYRRSTTTAVTLTVRAAENAKKLEASAASSPGDAEAASLGKKKVKLTGHDILPVKEDIDALEDAGAIPFALWLLYMVVPCLIFCGGRIAVALRGRRENASSVMTARAREALREAARAKAGDSEEFLSHLYRALTSAVLAKAGCEGASVTYLEAEDILGAKGTNEKDVRGLVSFMKQIDAVRYGGAGLDEGAKEKLFAETRELVRKLL